MARYATNEKQYYCDHCDKWITEREMVSRGIFLEVHDHDETLSAYCPGCRVTKWTRIVTLGAVDPVLQESSKYIVQAAQPGDTFDFMSGQGTGWSYFREYEYELINDDELL